MDSKKSIMNLKLSSKAKTLEDLRGVIKSAEVLPLVRFKALEYKKEQESILNKIIDFFDTEVIVRSSSVCEDSSKTSNAGGFESCLNVALNRDDLHVAILHVIDSYGGSLSLEDEVFIQPMLKKVTLSGVVFTADLDTLAPYFIVNYDDSGSTCSVTNGKAEKLKTFIAIKSYKKIEDENLEKLFVTCRECEKIFGNHFLDIEFAFVEDKLYVLQVRQIVQTKKLDLSKLDLNSSLNNLHKKIKKLNTSHPKLLGKKSIYGVMPDWNPAEIIGIRPKRLALSLYKELITDEIWAYQRDNYGYRNLRSFPLLVSFLGVPFIDVRVSFNSFVPKNLHEDIASKLVEYYLEELVKNSNHHDKVEFEILFSCYYFGIEKKLKKLTSYGFTQNEIKRVEFELLELTNKIIDTDNGLYKQDLKKIEKLKGLYGQILDSNLSMIDKIYWLIEDCKRYGTLPFAGVARAGFIAMQFLNSFVEEKIITKKEKDSFLNSLYTISKKLSFDLNFLDKEEFLKIYGHLRPGTYEITSKRYDEAYSEYFSSKHKIKEQKEFSFSNLQREKIDKLIIQNGIKSDSFKLINFIKEAIEGREYAKFVFTKHLSKTLFLVEEFGKKLGISREDLAHLDIHRLKDLYSSFDYEDVREIFLRDIEKNKSYYLYTKAVKFPILIVEESDIYAFYLKSSEANFITQNSISAKVVDIDTQNGSIVEGKIVCITSADPGYDFLFSKKIAGLITCYGGANSHMAIRCAELGIPAVIGCGEYLFKKYKKAKSLTIDAINKRVILL